MPPAPQPMQATGPGSIDNVDALARSACAGDRAAFDDLAAALRPRLVAVLWRKLGHRADAEDTAQAALLRWWQKRDTYDPTRPFLPWLLTVALRLATDEQRAGARRADRTLRLAQQRRDDAAPDPDALERAERREAVWGTVRDTVGGDTATALWLFYGEAMSVAEIAAVVGKRAGAVRVMLHRGRASLRPHLAAWDPSPAGGGAEQREAEGTSARELAGERASAHEAPEAPPQTARPTRAPIVGAQP